MIRKGVTDAIVIEKESIIVKANLVKDSATELSNAGVVVDIINSLTEQKLFITNPATPNRITTKVALNGKQEICYQIRLNTHQLQLANDLVNDLQKHNITIGKEPTQETPTESLPSPVAATDKPQSKQAEPPNPATAVTGNPIIGFITWTKAQWQADNPEIKMEGVAIKYRPNALGQYLTDIGVTGKEDKEIRKTIAQKSSPLMTDDGVWMVIEQEA
ncbi:MAG: hypothetical protein LRY40_09450 [Shewanella fodinae]|nr:hypothetical protein [Shewanella fodinae]